ncbi:MAG TPA: type II toxin-antitoxin system RelE/ParE family toxin [Pseudoxanthomonas sp.]|nr:type II toxin-antitoxin system RelE/ParE family toxin [Pseudoxanthomonas sp.]
MSSASICVETRTEAWVERLQPWIAALVSALLHLLALLVLLSSSTPIVTSSEGGDSGSRVKVDFIGESNQPQQQAPPSPPPSPTPRPAQPSAAASPVRSTLVDRSDDPVPPKAAIPAEGLTTAPAPRPAERPEESPPQPADVPADTAQSQARRPAANPPTTTRRRPHVWGQPPGMLPQESAPVNAGQASRPASGQGRRNDSSSAQPNLEVGGYQVYYDLRSEAKLRAWRDQGMTELFLPLPGTTKYMICPLEIALRRESGPCRLLEPDSPELANIGDAREVIFMQQVYRQGELVWRGPGAYR